TVRKIATPGTKAIHDALSRYCDPVRSIERQLGVGGTTPTPRNESDASVTSAVATPSVACTMIGAVILRQIWRRMIVTGETPTTRAAATYSRSRSESVWPRARRAIVV